MIETIQRDSFQGHNTEIWDAYYRGYQKESLTPGVRYPNEHLVRFLMSWKKSSSWDKKKRPKVLELGFGNITNMVMMYENGCDVDGLEVSPDAVARAQKAIKELGLGEGLNIGTYEGPEINRPANLYDAVIGLQCVYYNLDQEFFSQECARVLKPGGLLFLSFFSPRHGYMDYIDGRPGGVVHFLDAHPNPRLKGLNLFLYSGEKQFSETYGKYFSITVGLDEFDLIPVFQSWYYVRGQKKDSLGARRLSFPISQPEAFNPESTVTKTSETSHYLARNINIWNQFMSGLPSKDLFNGQRYPDEQIVRFLATWNKRREGDYFVNSIGAEDRYTKVENLKVLEINFLNTVHQKVMKDFGYEAFGVTYSAEALKRGLLSLEMLGLEEKAKLALWDGKRIPQGEGTFDMLISTKAAYYQPDQREFVKECARILKKGGEVFLYYLSPRHGYCKYLEPVCGNLYQYASKHPNPKLAGLTVFLADKEDLVSIWGEFFQIEVRYFEFNTYPTFSSFYVLTGARR